MSKSNFNSFNALPEMEKVKLKHQFDEFEQLIAFAERRSRARARADNIVREEAKKAVLAAYTKMHSEAW